MTISAEQLAAHHARYRRVKAVQARTPQLTAAHVSFEVRTELDDSDPGESFADELADEVAAIHARLEDGDYDAWCGVIVTAHWNGIEASDSVWGCVLDSGYTTAVVADEHGLHQGAVAALNLAIAERLEAADTLRSELGGL